MHSTFQEAVHQVLGIQDKPQNGTPRPGGGQAVKRHHNVMGAGIVSEGPTEAQKRATKSDQGGGDQSGRAS